MVIVEDIRAKKIVLGSLEKIAPQTLKEFHIQVRPGGTSRIYKDIQAYANSGNNDIFVLFDGDHCPTKAIPSLGELPQGKRELEAIIQQITSGLNSKGPKLDFVGEAEMTRYLTYFLGNVYYLPSATPEELVWSEKEVEQIINREIPVSIASELNAKTRIERIAKLLPGLDSDAVFSLLLARFITSSSAELEKLTQIINQIRSKQ